MPINYAKEYLMFVQTGVVFLPFHVRVKNGRHYSNFEKKNLKFEIYIIFYIYFQKMTVFFVISRNRVCASTQNLLLRYNRVISGTILVCIFFKKAFPKTYTKVQGLIPVQTWLITRPPGQIHTSESRSNCNKEKPTDFILYLYVDLLEFECTYNFFLTNISVTTSQTCYNGAST